MSDDSLLPVTIVPNDRAGLPLPAIQFTAASPGNVRVLTRNGVEITVVVEPGVRYTMQLARVFKTGTTARGLVAFVRPALVTSGAVVITLSDTQDLPVPISCLRVAVGGDVHVLLTDGTYRTLTLGNNELIYLNIRRVLSTGTTADGFSNGCLKGAPVTYVGSGEIPIPQNFTVTPDDTSVDLYWSPLEQPDLYATEVQFTSDDGDSWSTLDTDAEATFTVTGLLGGTDYGFRVRNYNRTGETRYSGFRTAFTTTTGEASELEPFYTEDGELFTTEDGEVFTIEG